MRISLIFTECEHTGDEERYKDDVRKCGGKIVSAISHIGNEELELIVDIDNTFLDKFKETESVEFTNLNYD